MPLLCFNIREAEHNIDLPDEVGSQPAILRSIHVRANSTHSAYDDDRGVARANIASGVFLNLSEILANSKEIMTSSSPLSSKHGSAGEIHLNCTNPLAVRNYSRVSYIVGAKEGDFRKVKGILQLRQNESAEQAGSRTSANTYGEWNSTGKNKGMGALRALYGDLADSTLNNNMVNSVRVHPLQYATDGTVNRARVSMTYHAQYAWRHQTEYGDFDFVIDYKNMYFAETVKVATAAALGNGYDFTHAGGEVAPFTTHADAYFEATDSATAKNTINSVDLVVGDKVAVQDQGTSTQNGIYQVVTVGDGGSAKFKMQRLDQEDEPFAREGWCQEMADGDSSHETVFNLNTPIMLNHIGQRGSTIKTYTANTQHDARADLFSTDGRIDTLTDINIYIEYGTNDHGPSHA